jgi:hypothetical protein
MATPVATIGDIPKTEPELPLVQTRSAMRSRLSVYQRLDAARRPPRLSAVTGKRSPGAEAT